MNFAKKKNTWRIYIPGTSEKISEWTSGGIPEDLQEFQKEHIEESRKELLEDERGKSF